MTIDEMEAATAKSPDEVLPAGCQRHPAYGDWKCKRGIQGCGVVHKDLPPAPVEAHAKVVSVKRRWESARNMIREREEMALKGQCFHCQGKMRELVAVLRMPGIKYFVCTVNPSHSVVILPEDMK